MEFNITNLDKVLLIQTLYAHASPVGYGKAEYAIRDFRGELVSGIPINECKSILANAKSGMPGARILDYHNGKPIKLVFFTRGNGSIITSSASYDERNGKYRFLEALLNVFNLDEILIAKKTYESSRSGYLDKAAPPRSKDQLLEFMSMLKHTIKHRDLLGTYWKFDLEKVDYKPPFM